MKLEFEYNFADYQQANRAHSAPPSRIQRLVLWLCVAWSVGWTAWSSFGPVQPPAKASIATTAPVPIGDILLPMSPFLPWLSVVVMVFVMGRSRIKTGGRRFKQATGQSSQWLSASMLLFFNIFLGAVSIAVGTARSADKSTNSDSAGWLEWVPWLALFVFLFFIFRNAFKKQWKQQPGLTRPKVFEYSPQSITMADDLMSTTYRWEAILRAMETPNLFLLYSSGLSFIMVPKRAFPSPDAIDGFRRLIQEWADGQSVGFPVIQNKPIDDCDE